MTNPIGTPPHELDQKELINFWADDHIEPVAATASTTARNLRLAHYATDVTVYTTKNPQPASAPCLAQRIDRRARGRRLVPRPATHRAIFAVDIAAFGDRSRDDDA